MKRIVLMGWRIVANFYCMCALALSLALAAPCKAWGSELVPEPMGVIHPKDPQRLGSRRNENPPDSRDHLPPDSPGRPYSVWQPDDRRTPDDSRTPPVSALVPLKPDSGPVTLEGAGMFEGKGEEIYRKPEESTFYWEGEPPEAIGRFDGNVLVKSPNQVAAVRDWIKKTGSDPLLLLDHSGNWGKVVAELSNHPKHFTIAHSVAGNLQSLQAIYGSRMSNAELAASKGCKNVLARMAQANPDNIDFLDLAPERDTVAANMENVKVEKVKDCRSLVLDQVDKMQKDDVLIILAHNSEGSLRFGDGTTCQVNEFLKAKGKIWIISCDTVDQLTPRPILRIGTAANLSYPAGIQAVQRTIEAIQKKASCRDLLKAMQRSKERDPLILGVVENQNVVELRPYT